MAIEARSRSHHQLLRLKNTQSDICSGAVAMFELCKVVNKKKETAYRQTEGVRRSSSKKRSCYSPRLTNAPLLKTRNIPTFASQQHY
ncbi:hypothetical protein DID88_000395 [Monilinia fructigena]|uniref:Uncharacterized protein n=1 Tax=Monilinia fructigena TaxID=38457 RepID=A0A395IHX3_9HELO|nr:hypothetical protein DID88_000395 [Monilinia fructigena]